MNIGANLSTGYAINPPMQTMAIEQQLCFACGHLHTRHGSTLSTWLVDDQTVKLSRISLFAASETPCPSPDHTSGILCGPKTKKSLPQPSSGANKEKPCAPSLERIPHRRILEDLRDMIGQIRSRRPKLLSSASVNRQSGNATCRMTITRASGLGSLPSFV